MVVWEFGRVNFWDVATGKASESVELKMGGRGNPWAIRRHHDKTEVLAFLSRVAAQDVVSLYLPPFSTPLRVQTIPSVDAQAIQWSQCGRWLAVLDSSLGTQYLHVYSADGYLFKSLPPRHSAESIDDGDATFAFDALGYKNLGWSPWSLALTSTQEITILDAQRFSTRTRLTLSDFSRRAAGLEDGTFAFQESISASGARSHSFLTGSAMPKPSSKAILCDVQFNSDGTLIAARDESAPACIYVWDIQSLRRHVLLQQHSAVRRCVWHPHLQNLIMLISEDCSLHVWDLSSERPPVFVQHSISQRAETTRVDAKWISPPKASVGDDGSQIEKLGILITTKKSGWQILWPEGRPVVTTNGDNEDKIQATPEGDVSRDSLYDILTGRTPLPQLQISSDKDPDMAQAEGLDDTFREKRQAQAQVAQAAPDAITRKDFDDDPDIF